MTTTNQPKWRLLTSTDSEALFVDETGVYPPELMTCAEYDDKFIVHRFPLERCKTEKVDDTEYLVPFEYQSTWPHPVHRYVPWFYDSLDAVADACGMSKEEIVSGLVSDNPHALAAAYASIGGYHGLDNFDSYPETWTEPEMRKKWP